MKRGLLYKVYREARLATLLFGVALLCVEAILAYVIPRFHEQFAGQWLQMPFVQNILRSLLGTDVGDAIGAGALAAIAWVHPVVLAIVWAHEIVFCTRNPAGEIDRGTIDLLLGLPLTRWDVYLVETLAWLLSGAFIIGLGVVGCLLGGLAVPPEARIDKARLVVIVANFFCLYVAVGGLAWLVSALSSYRGRAIGLVFAIVVASFLLNFLAQVWTPAQAVARLSVLNYYRPLFILRDVTWPVADMLCLVLIGAAFWLAGGLAFARRDVCTI